MDAMLGNMRNSLEGSVRKMLTGQLSQKKALQSEKSKTPSKVFSIALTDLCASEKASVPYVVKDICEFIETHHLNLEGIFRISAPSANVNKLREAFERSCDSYHDGSSVTQLVEVDGHTAANVLKQFFRFLPEPLIPDEILKLCRETKCVSDETFATSARMAMDSWPAAHRCTLQYLLTFLRSVMKNTENRMTGSGLAVVFGPNTFRISSGIEGLEELTCANQTFERLLLTSDIISDSHRDDQGYLDMTSHTVSQQIKPVRVAPPVPLKARPLPPPPVPAHLSLPIDFPDTVEPQPPPPVVPNRCESLRKSLEFVESSLLSSEDFSDEEEIADTAISAAIDKELIDETIRDVVKKRLFTADSSGSSYAEGIEVISPNIYDENDDIDAVVNTLLPSLTAGRNKGPRNRRKPSRQSRSGPGDESCYSDSPSSSERLVTCSDLDTPPTPVQRKSLAASRTSSEPASTVTNNDRELAAMSSLAPSTTTVTTVITPDSGCLTAEEDLSRAKQMQLENREVFIPKLNLPEPLDENEDVLCDMAEVVPPLDLSEVTQSDEVLAPKPLPRHVLPKTTKHKKRKRKDHRNAQSTVHETPVVNMSEPINVPMARSAAIRNASDVEASPEASPSRWRDAWSTDDENYAPVPAEESYLKARARFPSVKKDQDVDFAPSSPVEHEGFLEHHQLHHKHHHQHHHHKHHHHHHHNHSENGLTRPKLQPSLINDDENLEKIRETLQELMICLENNRTENVRPEDITLMTREQIKAEKVAMQRELLKYEDRHGRPTTKKEKDLMRIVYDRYRMVKRLMVDAMSPPLHAPANRRYDDIEPVNDYELAFGDNLTDEFAVTQLVTLAPVGGKVSRGFGKDDKESRGHIAGDLDIQELLRQQKATKAKKKRLRRKLRDFEKEIEKQHGRSIIPADRVVMATEYAEYRDLKGKSRLLDALIEKHNSHNQ